MKNNNRDLPSLVLFASLTTLSLLAQGPLIPPGPPSETMKTLDLIRS